MKPYLRKIDTKTLGNRYDVTPVFADAECFAQLVEDLASPFQSMHLDGVACIDALGFILGTAVACRLRVAVIPIRKGGKLPVETDTEEFCDYSGVVKRLEIRRDVFQPQARVLLVDEWIETGAQIRASIKLIEGLGGIVAGVATINIDENRETAEIRRKYRIHSVWKVASN